MLTAKMKDGKVISLGETFDRAFLTELRKKETFYCRHCSERVHLKLGTKRIFHFAHEKGAQCAGDYERESEYHLNGKLQLYQWLKSQGLNPKLETYFPTIKQRADLSFHYKGKKYALEFQCSPITEEMFRQRTAGYMRISYQPLWLLGGKQIRRTGSRKVSFSHFHTYFLRKNSRLEWYLPSYCPETKQFIFLTPVYFLSAKNAIASFHLLEPRKLPVEKLADFHFHQEGFPFDLWRKELNKQKFAILTQKRAHKNPFLQELYARGLHIHCLPPFVGIPLKHHAAFYESPLIWQTYVFLDHLFEKQKGHVVTFHDVYVSLLKRIKRGGLAVRYMPGSNSPLMASAIKNYLSLLADFQVLRRHDEHTFSLKETLTWGKTMDECLQEENWFYEKHQNDMIK